MALLEASYVKQNFPTWEHFAGYDTEAADTDAALSNQISLAETELAEYVSVTESTITDPIKRHLFHIVRYNLFMLQHADTDFERSPRIVKEYERTLKMLTDLRDGHRPATPNTPGTSQGSPKITAKKRRMTSWFTDTGSSEVNSTDS